MTRKYFIYVCSEMSTADSISYCLEWPIDTRYRLSLRAQTSKMPRTSKMSVEAVKAESLNLSHRRHLCRRIFRPIFVILEEW